MKTILLWDPRFPDRRPARLTVEDAVASAAVRAGVAAAANPAEAGALSVGGALDPSMLTEVVLQHGAGGATRRVFLPYSVVMIGAAAGVLASIATPFPGGVPPTPTPTPTIFNNFPTLKAAQQSGQRVTIAALGDSLTAGWGSNGAGGGTSSGASGDANNFRKNRSRPAELAKLFVAAGYPARCDALFANGATASNTIAEAVASYTPQLSFGAGTGWIVATAQKAAGGFLIQANPSAIPVTFAPVVAADTFDIYTVNGASSGAYSVTDASGTLGTIPAGGASSTLRKTVISRPASSTGPISIQPAAGGSDTIFIAAIIPYDTKAPMIEIWNMGYAGSKVSDWQTATSAWSPFNIINAFAPLLFSINLGTNDAKASVLAATFQTQLQALVDRCKQTSDVTIIKTNIGATGTTYNMPTSYLTAIDAIIANSTLQPAINFRDNVTLTIADSDDGLHWVNSGYAKQAVEEFSRLKA